LQYKLNEANFANEVLGKIIFGIAIVYRVNQT